MPVVTLKPEEILIDDTLTFYSFDAKKKIDYFTSHDDKIPMATPRFKTGPNFLTLEFKGEVAGKGINVMMFGKKTSYSFALALEPDVLDAFLKLEQWLTDYCVKTDLLGDYEQTTFVHDDRIYIRLKTDDKNLRFVTASNLKLNPKRVEDANIYQGQAVTVKCDIGAYFNFGTQKTGINLGLKEVIFAEE